MFTQKFYDRVKHTIMKQIKGCTTERVEDVTQIAFEALIKKLDQGVDIIDPMGFLVVVAKRKYYTILSKESRVGNYIPWNHPSSVKLEESFLGEHCKDVLLELSRGHSIRDVAEYFGLTYYRVWQIRENWINS